MELTRISIIGESGKKILLPLKCQMELQRMIFRSMSEPMNLQWMEMSDLKYYEKLKGTTKLIKGDAKQ